MPTTLTIPVSDAVLARLQTQAAAQGTTPEAVAADCVAESPRLQSGYGGLRRLAGTVPLGEGNVSERIDEGIGNALVEELRGKPDAGLGSHDY